MTSAHRPDDDGSYADVSAYAYDESQDPVRESEPTDPGPESGETIQSEKPKRKRAAGDRTGLSHRRKGVLLVVGAALGLGLFLSVYQMGQPATQQMPENHPPINAAATTASPAPLNEALVAELTAKVEADPNDAQALYGLGEEYSRVGDYATAATWQSKLVEVNPDNKDNRLILGVTYYNDAQYAPAEEQWLAAADLDPQDPGPWYNLGFLYLSLEPPADQKAEDSWRKVTELAPGSDMAQTVTEHLDRLDSMPQLSPAPSATPGR